MRGVIRAVQVQEDAPRLAPLLALAQVHLGQGVGQPVAGPSVHPRFQPRARRLAGECRSCQRLPTADQLQQRVVAQAVRVVLVLVPAGDGSDDPHVTAVEIGRRRE
jgi:hypothetical protein